MLLPQLYSHCSGKWYGGNAITWDTITNLIVAFTVQCKAVLAHLLHKS